MTNEQERLAELRSYRVLDTHPTESFNRVVRLAADLFEVPMAAISLIDSDRQWFKAQVGVEVSETPRSVAFCHHTIQQENGLLVVEDATRDSRFRNNPFVTGDANVRFYAGAALTSPAGHNLGALCVIDTKPLHPSKSMLAQLEILAKLAVGELELGKANAATAEKEQLLDLAERMSGVGHWRYDLECGRITWSDEVYRIHGVTPETYNPALDDAISFYAPEEQSRIRSALAEAASTGNGYQFERQLIARDGIAKTVITKAVCEKNSVGKVVAIFGVFQDITDHKRALNEANAAVAVKAEFLANMSHELRTPLTSVIGFAELLRLQPELSERSAGYVDRVISGSEALLATVNDVLDFSKLEAGQVEIRPRPTPLRKSLTNAVEFFALQADAKGISIGLEIAPSVPDTGLIDPDRLRQILLNLVGNAVKFTSAGSVSVAVHYDETDTLRITVSDTGPGIAPEQATKLFQRFSQIDGSLNRGHGGTGLGLAICRGLAEAMHGDIGLESAVGKGSTFRVTLACPSASQSAATGDTRAQTFSLDAYRILVVDDNPSNRALVAASLQATGVELTLASGGEDAIEKAATMLFDLILLDLHMPRVDGSMALRTIREGGGPNSHIPILAFTADVDVSKLQDVGFDGTVSKPVSPSALIRQITDVLSMDAMAPAPMTNARSA